MTIRSPKNFILPLAAALALLVNHASAGTTWNGNFLNSGNWDAANNWEGALPTFSATTDLLFRNTSTQNRTVSQIMSAKTVRSLTFNTNVTNGFEIGLRNVNNNTAINLTMGDGSNAAAITVNSGAVTNITIGRGTGAVNGNLILSNNLAIAQNSTAGTLIIDAPITGSGYGLTKSGAGSLVLSSTNTYTGATTISGGELVLSGSGRLSSSSALDLSGATARLNISGITAAGSTNASLAGIAGSVVNLGSKNLQVGGNNTSTTFAGVLTNTGSLTKSGTGTLTLSAANTYSGATTIEAGKLVVNNSVSSTTTVQSGASLGGSGSVASVNVQSGGTIDPGNSPGTLTITNGLTWAGGGNYNWQIFAVSGTAGATNTWDLINVTGGTWDITGLSSTNKFNINLWSLSGLPETSGPLAGFDATQNYSWMILASGGLSGTFNTNLFNINTGAINGTGGFAGATGLFSLAMDANNDLFLNYTGAGAAVPEPGTWAAAALLGAAIFWRRFLRGRRLATS